MEKHASSLEFFVASIHFDFGHSDHLEEPRIKRCTLPFGLPSSFGSIFGHPVSSLYHT